MDANQHICLCGKNTSQPMCSECSRKKWLNKIHEGDCLALLKDMPDNFVDCIITSPPYWGLRDYGNQNQQIWDGDANCQHEWVSYYRPANTWGEPNKNVPGIFKNPESNTSRVKESILHFCSKCGAWRGQLGLEPTPELYVKHLVEIFREVRRVLKKEGTFWLNLGDSYARVGGDSSQKGRHWDGRENNPITGINRYATEIGLKPKDLVGIPWRVAFALQTDGWWLRQDIIWGKPNPMPESVTDRCTKSHEYIFLLAKSQHYYYDNEAIKETAKEGEDLGILRSKKQAELNTPTIFKRQAEGIDSTQAGDGNRNKRSVWTITTKPFSEAHFATFPEELIRPMIMAGTSEKGDCPACGDAWERILEHNTLQDTEKNKSKVVVTSDTPYAVIEREGVVITRKLPPQKEVCEFLKDAKNKAGITIEQIETAFGGFKAHHWFEEGGSVPDRDDWLKLKVMLDFDDKYDKLMTTLYEKPAEKMVGNYRTQGWRPACKCNKNPIPSVVMDIFSGSGTTSVVAKRLGRSYIGLELNPEYVKMSEQRLSLVGKEDIINLRELRQNIKQNKSLTEFQNGTQ